MQALRSLSSFNAIRWSLPACLAIGSATVAQADLNAWLSAVNAGTANHFVQTGIAAPTNVDIGIPNATNGITYEFIVNATNNNTSALLGSRNTGFGNNSGIKFEQYFGSMQYGVTDFGIADYFFPGNNTTGQDVHLVFYSDPNANKTSLHVNGTLVGTVTHAVLLEGLVGLGQIHDPGGDFDVLTGTIQGVAIYAGLLPQAEIQAHHDAYFGSLGTSFCDPMDLNCHGTSTVLSALATSAAPSGVHLASTNGPPNEFGYVLIGTAVSDPGLALSNGRLCLAVSGGNGFGRYNVVGGNLNSVGQFDATGTQFHNLVGTGTSAGGTGFDVPLTVPMTGSPMIMTGQTWHFQLWHRDACGGPSASNFSNGVSIPF